jgi:hypothetical protein
VGSADEFSLVGARALILDDLIPALEAAPEAIKAMLALEAALAAQMALQNGSIAVRVIAKCKQKDSPQCPSRSTGTRSRRSAGRC